MTETKTKKTFIAIETCHDPRVVPAANAPFRCDSLDGHGKYAARKIEAVDIDEACRIALNMGDKYYDNPSDYNWKVIADTVRGHRITVYEVAAEKDAGLAEFVAKNLAEVAKRDEEAAKDARRRQYEELKKEFSGS